MLLQFKDCWWGDKILEYKIHLTNLHRAYSVHCACRLLNYLSFFHYCKVCNITDQRIKYSQNKKFEVK